MVKKFGGRLGIRSFALVMLAVAPFVSQFAAEAASFDCKKATGKVERRVCANPELSQLDAQLARAYDQALKNAKDPTALKTAQRQWLKDRNNCAEDACIRQTYQHRLAVFSNSDADKKLAQAKYPPYPEVWHRQLSSPPRLKGYDIGFYLGESGDQIAVSIAESRTDPDGGHHTSRLVSIGFFSGEMSLISEIDEFYQSHPLVHQHKNAITLTNGIRVSVKNLDPRMTKYCPQALNHYFSIEYPDGRAPRRMSLLRILEKPRRVEIDERCAGTAEAFISEKVESLWGYMVPLADGGFLIGDRLTGYIVRFDANLESKSDLLDKVLFWVDSAVVKQQDTDETNVSYQAIQDSVLKNLLARRK